MKPTVGRIVHYTSYGTPGGEYASECRAAIVSAVTEDPGVVDLVVLNPEGMFFNRGVHLDHASIGEPAHGGHWHWPEREEG